MTSVDNEAGSRSRAKVWIISAWIALLLYVFSGAPVKYGCMKHGYWRELSQVGPSGSEFVVAPPLVVDQFYMPADWLIDHLRLSGPMDAYGSWWYRVFN